MIPYIDLGAATSWVFWALVGVATCVGFGGTVRRSSRAGIPNAASLTAWMILWGFVGAHALHMLTDDREALRENPLSLLALWQGMSSFGGMLGGVAAALVIMRWRRITGASMLRYLDCVAFVFPFAWIFGRLGCAIAHDHPGLPTNHWLAVRFPDGPRWDLGVLELIYTLAVAAVFAWQDRSSHANGFWLAIFLVAYGPARFALDTLRIGDTRYVGWTPAQYLSLAATIAGLFLLSRSRRPIV